MVGGRESGLHLCQMDSEETPVHLSQSSKEHGKAFRQATPALCVTLYTVVAGKLEFQAQQMPWTRSHSKLSFPKRNKECVRTLSRAVPWRIFWM